MPFPDVTAYYGAEDAARAQLSAQPPQHILDAIGGSYDQSKYYWDPLSMSLVARDGSGTYNYSHIPNPALGTNVMAGAGYGPSDLGYGGGGTNIGVTQPGFSDTLHFGPGENPYIAFPEGNGIFASSDPAAIDAYQHDAQTRNLQGVATIGALVGGGAALNALGGPAGVTTGSQGYTAPTAVGGTSATAAPGTFGQAAFLPSSGAGAGGAAVASVPTAAGAASNFLSRYGDYIIPGVNALLGARAADQASDAETAALQAAIEEQRRQYDTTRADLMPWLDAGRGALGRLQDPNANFLASPDYEFRRGEGIRDIGNTFSARGMGQSGNALRALTEYNSNLASGEFNNWWNRQSSLAGLGQTTGTNLGQLGQNTSANVGNYLTGQGVSRASGVLGRYGAIGNGINDAYYNYLYRRAG